jgi:hydroxyacylglutathione hydrolase
MQIRIIPVTPFQQNCAIVHCLETGEGAVVDPGGDLDRVLAEAESHHVKLTKILLTHGHLDHAGATSELAAKLDLPIEGPHRDEEGLIQALPAQAQMFGFPSGAPFTPTRWLEQGDEVTVGAQTFEVRFCPGHTRGHVIFYNAAQKVALVGDVLFHGSIGRTDLPGGDHATLLASIKAQLLSLDDDVTFFSGHGPTSTIGVQREMNPYIQDL